MAVDPLRRPVAPGRTRNRPDHGPEIHLLGDFCASHDGKRVDLPSSAQRVVAFVALEGQPVQRARVAGALWLDVTHERSLASLRSALWRLRQVGESMGDSLVDAKQAALQLAPGVRVDAVEAVAVARSIIGGAVPPAAADVVDLLSTDLLPGWYDDDWLLLWRERWRQLRLHALEVLAGSLAGAGRTAEAVDAAVAAVRGEPLRESARRCLVELHLTEGNHCEAVREYEAFRRLLQDEMGMDPSAPFARLVRDP